jgi:hypothetical protein
MRSGLFERLARWGAGIVLILSFCAPTTAQAGCNHPAGGSAAMISGQHGLDELITRGSASSAQVGQTQFPWDRSAPGRPVPCSGLRCSNSTPLPGSTAAGGLVGSDQWAALATRLWVDPPSRPAQAIDEPILHLPAYNTFLFHPPRT